LPSRPPAPPDPRLLLDPSKMGLRPAGRRFYRRRTETVARDLIGAWLARRYRDRWYGARIVETEAYLGAADAAAHTWRGRRTPRVEPMYRDGGHLYVFFVYGMHHCANIVTRTEGVGEAVLLRAAEGRPGVPARLLSGPGRLCAALGINEVMSGIDLPDGELVQLFLDRRSDVEIGVAARIGVDYAGEAKNWPLRYFDLHSPSVSRLCGDAVKKLYS
jgi:DNA-3-methyladenine glycosylase